MDRLEVGYVARAHGLRGELTFGAHDPASTVYLDVDRVYIDGREYALVAARPANKYTIVRLEGVIDRNTAEALRGRTVEVDRASLPHHDGEVLLADFVGLAVEAVDGASLGTVVDIETGPQDRLVVHEGQTERLIPIVPELLTDVDFATKRIIVDLPDGWPETPVR